MTFLLIYLGIVCITFPLAYRAFSQRADKHQAVLHVVGVELRNRQIKVITRTLLFSVSFPMIIIVGIVFTYSRLVYESIQKH